MRGSQFNLTNTVKWWFGRFQESISKIPEYTFFKKKFFRGTSFLRGVIEFSGEWGWSTRPNVTGGTTGDIKSLKIWDFGGRQSKNFWVSKIVSKSVCQVLVRKFSGEFTGKEDSRIHIFQEEIFSGNEFSKGGERVFGKWGWSTRPNITGWATGDTKTLNNLRF